MSIEKRKRLVIDLDGTICTQQQSGMYHLAEPIKPVIDAVNALWLSGWEVVIYTARGMTSYGSAESAEKALGQMTVNWLKENRVCFDGLVFGKPSGDVYVDDKGATIEALVTGRLER